MSNKKSTKYEVPFFKVPFPPEVTVEEILATRSEEKLKSRAPNRYLIYRIAFLKELRKRTDDNVPMTRISGHISSLWRNESAVVRDAYKDLSDQVEERLKEIRQREKLVMITEFPNESQDLQDHSPSGMDKNNVINPLFSNINYQRYDQLFPSTQQFLQPLHPQHPPLFEITENYLPVNPDYTTMFYFDPLYQFFTPVDNYMQTDFEIPYPIDSCLCETCWNHFDSQF
ncbi:hypothetical protein C1646_760492 [Rhizophagus diaphanus]|nr:hypothetical protein C1646_760492 [Rhizophagus diaphanus] [Rhizophagus sp. MUCL 43196]